MKKVYLVVITEWEEYRNSHVFETKFEAEKFIRHNILDSTSWQQFIEEKEVLP
jgi:hypothetical protein